MSGRNVPGKKTHPIRGILWGLMLGLGLAIVLIVTTVINLELSQIIIVVLVGTVVGFLWSMLRQVVGPLKAIQMHPGV